MSATPLPAANQLARVDSNAAAAKHAEHERTSVAAAMTDTTPSSDSIPDQSPPLSHQQSAGSAPFSLLDSQWKMCRWAALISSPSQQPAANSSSDTTRSSNPNSAAAATAAAAAASSSSSLIESVSTPAAQQGKSPPLVSPSLQLPRDVSANANATPPVDASNGNGSNAVAAAKPSSPLIESTAVQQVPETSPALTTLDTSRGNSANVAPTPAAAAPSSKGSVAGLKRSGEDAGLDESVRTYWLDFNEKGIPTFKCEDKNGHSKRPNLNDKVSVDTVRSLLKQQRMQMSRIATSKEGSLTNQLRLAFGHFPNGDPRADAVGKAFVVEIEAAKQTATLRNKRASMLAEMMRKYEGFAQSLDLAQKCLPDFRIKFPILDEQVKYDKQYAANQPEAEREQLIQNANKKISEKQAKKQERMLKEQAQEVAAERVRARLLVSAKASLPALHPSPRDPISGSSAHTRTASVHASAAAAADSFQSIGTPSRSQKDEEEEEEEESFESEAPRSGRGNGSSDVD